MQQTVRLANERFIALAADFGERLFLVLLFGWFMHNVGPSLAAASYNWPLVAVEAFTVLLVLIRKPGPISMAPYPWAVAVTGTCAGLMVLPGGGAVVAPGVGGALMVAGLLISLAAKIFLNRSFGMVAANRGVKRHGPYRFVRHPMYLGYMVAQSGFLLLHFSLWNVAVYAVAWTAQLLRIRTEEEFLLQDPAYRDYAAGVRYRLIPGIF